MVDEKKSLAGRKGGAVRRAKALARRENMDVFDNEFGFIARPSGNIQEIPTGLAPGGQEGEDFIMNDRPTAEVIAHPATGDLPAEVIPPERVAHAATELDDTSLHVPAELTEADMAEPEEAPVVAAVKSLADQMQGYLDQGLSETDALVLINAKYGGGDQPVGQGTPAAPGGGEQMGPDPAIVARYNEMLQGYVEPVRNLAITIENPDGDDWTATIPVRYLDYLTKASMLETAKRRRDVNIADFIQMIVRKYKANDADTAVLMGTMGGTGPASGFDPATGTYKL